ncbi:iron ABC transporter permease [Fodinisporobacter ferrooxydans]|uniref:Iron ABC transporter permease n=1 Tax=Fodinisporobacter ferrooxydans TaxID=2901836 RepID=A0ABY4CKY6_9BACL|nr:iron ABC transporter permease [Alicyclobacillaceae bacterium MYW30-H2]
MAWVCAYTDVRLKNWMQVFVFVPYVIPSYVMTIAWTQFIGPAGLINRWASTMAGHKMIIWDVYGLNGMVLLLALTNYPLVFLITRSVLYRIPRDLELAAKIAGARNIHVFRKIILPMALPGLAGGGLLAFISSLDNFGIPSFLGIPKGISVLSTFIYEQVVGYNSNNFAKAAVLSIILGIIALLGTAVQWFLVRNSKTDQTFSEDRSIRFSFGKYRLIIEIGIWLFFLVTSVFPLLAMIQTALIKAYGLPFTLKNLTWSNFTFILQNNDASQNAIKNSLMLACATALLCVLIGTVFAYWRVKKPTLLAKAMEWAITLPYAIPGMVLSLSLILTWSEPISGWKPGIYGTTWMIFIAYMTRFLVLQIRTSSASILQVGEEVEEAASIHGGRWLTRWKKILVPLYSPGIVTGACLVFLTSLSELTVSSLLWSAGNETIGVVIFNFEQEGSTTYSTAFSTLIVLAILVFIVTGSLVKKFWIRRVKL